MTFPLVENSWGFLGPGGNRLAPTMHKLLKRARMRVSAQCSGCMKHPLREAETPRLTVFCKVDRQNAAAIKM